MVQRVPRLLSLCVLALLVTIATACAPGDVPPDPAVGDEPAPFTILWAGDTLLGDAAQPLLDAAGYAAPFRDLLPLPAADFVIVNAEGPITTRTAPWDTGQRWSYRARPPAADALAAAGVDAAGLANNHSLDRGPGGLADTRRLLEAGGVATFGAGMNAEEAVAPLLIDTPYGRVAVVGFGEDAGRDRLATATHAGSLVPTYTAVQRGIDRGRAAGADWIVAFVHWGTNYRNVTGEQRRWAQRFAEAGYDLVVGHGPHLAQPIDFVDSMPVVYSLGNFVFGTPGRYDGDAPGYSIMVRVELAVDGFHRATIHCLLTDNDRVAFRPRFCPEAEARDVIGALHPRMTVVNGIGAVSW